MTKNVNAVNKPLPFHEPNKLAIFLLRQELLLVHKLAETNNDSIHDILLGKGLKLVQKLQKITGGNVLEF